MVSVKKKSLSGTQVRAFQRDILSYYQKEGRSFAWRDTRDPYRILISEIMLQQTQTLRVSEKYAEFIAEFPTIQKLAKASLPKVLKIWQGLGYNRRARYLRDMAIQVCTNHGGKIPTTQDELMRFPGVGPYTAGAVCVFAFDQPKVLIETNIRAVFLHEFFRKARNRVADQELVPYIERTIDAANVRRWYYALMDYGVFLKKQTRGINHKSKHHSRQSRFSGSVREIRGMILRLLLSSNGITLWRLHQKLDKFESEKTDRALSGLIADGFIKAGRGKVLKLIN